jgi:hypothetical protein
MRYLLQSCLQQQHVSAQPQAEPVGAGYREHIAVETKSSGLHAGFDKLSQRPLAELVEANVYPRKLNLRSNMGFRNTAEARLSR